MFPGVFCCDNDASDLPYDCCSALQDTLFMTCLR
jgi:hypothetical protein